MTFIISVKSNLIPVLIASCLLGSSASLRGQSYSADMIEDRELLEIMIEDSTSELARNQASLDQARAVQGGLTGNSSREVALQQTVEEHILYYEELISSQTMHLQQLRDQRTDLERRELATLRNLRNFGSPYQDQRRTAFLDLILKPKASTARFGDTGTTRMEELDAELFAAIGGLQGRLNQETENRQEAGYILLDRESSVQTIVDMQKVSQAYYDERFVLYDKMNQTYEQILRWRPDLAFFFRPPPEPKSPEAYKRALERMQADN